ncbi:hypothetical protein CHUAL_007575 [Chamberlinius hualienensis]
MRKSGKNRGEASGSGEVAAAASSSPDTEGPSSGGPSSTVSPQGSGTEFATGESCSYDTGTASTSKDLLKVDDDVVAFNCHGAAVDL